MKCLHRSPWTVRSRTVGFTAASLAALLALAACSSTSTSAASSSAASSAVPTSAPAAAGSPAASIPALSASEAAGSPGACTKVAYLVNNVANPWISTMADGGEAEAKKLGASVKVQDANLDTAAQISQIQQAVADKVSGILIQSVEADGIVPAIKQANAAGIPVVAVNSGVGDGADIVTYVGVDQTDYGKGLANLAIKALPNGGKVAVIQGVVGNPVEVQRTAGIKDTLKAAGKYDVVATVTDSWNNDKNLAAVQDLLNKYPKGSLDAIIAEGPQIYVGAKYAQSIGRTDVKFIAGDFPVQVRDAIKSGSLFGTVLQDGAQQGVMGMDALCNWVNGKKSAVKQPTDFADLPLVTADNLTKYSTNWNW